MRGEASLRPAPLPPVDLHAGGEAFAASLRAAFLASSHQLRVAPLDDVSLHPLFVNEKQSASFIRRSGARKRRLALLALAGLQPAPGAAKHRSRQLHAARRVRGKGGRFLTKEEKEALERQLTQQMQQTNTAPATDEEQESATSDEDD